LGVLAVPTQGLGKVVIDALQPINALKTKTVHAIRLELRAVRGRSSHEARSLMSVKGLLSRGGLTPDQRRRQRYPGRAGVWRSGRI
jgi:hypothetical protein